MSTQETLTTIARVTAKNHAVVLAHIDNTTHGAIDRKWKAGALRADTQRLVELVAKEAFDLNAVKFWAAVDGAMAVYEETMKAQQA